MGLDVSADPLVELGVRIRSLTHLQSTNAAALLRIYFIDACVRTTSRMLLDPRNLMVVCFRPCAGLQCVDACWLLSYEHMRMHMSMCRITLDVVAKCRASRTFSARMLATRFLEVTAFRTCMAHIIREYVHQLPLPRVVASCTVRSQCNSWHHGERNE